MRSATARPKTQLAERLRARRLEIEATALTRVNAIADSSGSSDPSYVEGLRGAVTAAVDYGLAAVERGEEHAPPIPVDLRAQARIAARAGVSLDTVLRRYFAGYSLLGFFIVEEASRDGLMGGTELQSLLGAQAVIFDRLLTAIGEEHTREAETVHLSSERRRAERVERLLEGELVDTSPIAYDFALWHLGILASGSSAAEGVRGMAEALEMRLLVVERGEGNVWAWLGGRLEPDPVAVLDLVAEGFGGNVVLAVGEPGPGIDGWRLTHRQAAAALPVAQRGNENSVRYGDVALLASMLQDDLVVASLRRLYLDPLEEERDGGRAARKTLRAYLTAERNISSTAAILGINRNTVANRLRAIEERIHRPLAACVADLDAALRLDELMRPTERC